MNTIDDTRRTVMMRTVHEYFLACNTASRERFARTLANDCVHYFPPGVGGPFRGRDAIADLWIGFVRDKGSCWTIDRMVCDGHELAIEWTHFKPRAGEHIRGSEWYEFDSDGRISAIWAHYASPRDATRSINELEGFEYDQRAYAQAAPRLDPDVQAERDHNLAHESHGEQP